MKDRCYWCGGLGHRAAGCTARPFCWPCSVRGRSSTGHAAGGKGCPEYPPSDSRNENFSSFNKHGKPEKEKENRTSKDNEPQEGSQQDQGALTSSPKAEGGSNNPAVRKKRKKKRKREAHSSPPVAGGGPGVPPCQEEGTEEDEDTRSQVSAKTDTTDMILAQWGVSGSPLSTPPSTEEEDSDSHKDETGSSQNLAPSLEGNGSLASDKERILDPGGIEKSEEEAAVDGGETAENDRRKGTIGDGCKMCRRMALEDSGVIPEEDKLCPMERAACDDPVALEEIMEEYFLLEESTGKMTLFGGYREFLEQAVEHLHCLLLEKPESKAEEEKGKARNRNFHTGRGDS